MTNVINMQLRHEEFGDGKLKSFDGATIVVRFSRGDETLPFPQAFENGLKTTNAEDEKRIEEIAARWSVVHAYVEQRDTAIKADPRVEVAQAYDERKRLEKEADVLLAEEKKQKKQQYKEEAEKASAKK